MKKILISDPVDHKCEEILKGAGFDVDFRTRLSNDELFHIIKKYNGLIVRSETKATSELISKMENMEVIGRAGTGVDNIDLNAATRKGIIVMNTPGGNTISTAEHTMALMLSMFRNIPQANQSLRSGNWDRKSFKGTELYGKKIGIIGLGKIGREVASRSKSFGMKVIGYDPVLSDDIAEKMGIELVDLNTIFIRSDIITVHVPLTEETKHMINAETLGKCKDGIKIINCARGGIVNESDLVTALDSGKVSSAAFDVYEVEPPDLKSKLVNHPKVICTPHLGASTEEAQIKVAIQIAEQIVDLFNNGKIIGAVNATAIEAGSNRELTPFVNLAEKLGSLQAQIINGQLKQVNMTFSGELLHSSSRILSTAVMKGFLSRLRTESVNFVNAPFFFQEMGVIVNETKTGASTNYNNLLEIEFITDKEKRSLSGTVFGNSEMRLVNIDGFYLELKPEGDMIFYSNVDRPGVLSSVGKVLAESDINIAGLSLGRFGKGEKAITAISIDSPADKLTLKKISEIDGVKNVFAVRI
jgi:D-3-phosphoglycerate dehydrogenase